MKYETRLEMLKLSDIVAAPYNPREDIERGSDEYKALRRSIELNGMVEPPVVNLHNMRCIGGNQRLVVLRDLGWKEVLCSVIDQPDESKEMKLCLALNRIEGRVGHRPLGDLLRMMRSWSLKPALTEMRSWSTGSSAETARAKTPTMTRIGTRTKTRTARTLTARKRTNPPVVTMSLPWELRLSELDTYTSRWRSRATSVWSKASGTPASSTREKSPRR